jgi:uncharacterized membrane protein YkvA (DUF1232 family)
MTFARTTFQSRGSGGPGDADSLRSDFWRTLGWAAARIPFAEDLLAAYYCAFDRATPRHVQLALISAIAYFVLPTDAVPDVLPVIGFGDDAAVLAGTLKLVSDHLKPVHREAARMKLEEARTPAD